MSYSNPKQIQDRTFEISSGVADMQKQQYLQEVQQRQANIGSAIQAGMQVAQSILPKKQELKEFTKGQQKKGQDLYDKVGSYNTGYEAYDQNSDIFFHDLTPHLMNTSKTKIISTKYRHTDSESEAG